MSYTLRGRLESRLAALLPALVGACTLAAVLHRWWPVELAALMALVGLLLDAAVYDRLLDYQPGWAALPLGLLELGLVVALARAAGVEAPLGAALAFYATAWLTAQLLGHAALPVLRLGYAEEGGELGRAGLGAAAAVGALLVGAAGFAYSTRPPVVHLSAGIHQGPLVISRREVLQGEPGTIVRGGIVVRADDVTIRDVGVVGGENGIVVDGRHGVKLVRVSVSGARLDGIHVRRAGVTIEDCAVDMLGNRFGQGIDISYAADRAMSMIEGCTVVGGQEGIVTHSATSEIVGNRVSRTTLRAISMTEMSMGSISRNEVRDALGIGIYCNDHSTCMVDGNVVVDTRSDRASGNLWRLGYGVLASYDSEAELHGNRLDANPRPSGAVLDSVVRG